MKKLLVAAFVPSILLPTTLRAGDLPGSAAIATAAAPRSSGWEFGIAATAILGAEADFSDLGGWQSPSSKPPKTGNFDREYDDGFNRVDATGNTGNLTSYWGYDRAAQYDPSGGGSISMSIYNGRADGSASDEATGWGGEIFATREVGALSISRMPGATWGWRFAFNVNKFSFEDDSTISTTVDRLTDTYGLGGAVPPGAPFSGSPTGFGNAILGDQPSRVTSTQFAATSGSRDLDAVLFGFSAGPYLDIPIAGKFSVRLDAGVTLAIVHGDYSVSSVTTIAGLGSQTASGSDTETDFLPGVYAGASGIYEFTPQLSMIASARYQYLDSYEVNAANSRAELEFSDSFIVSIGAIFKF